MRRRTFDFRKGKTSVLASSLDEHYRCMLGKNLEKIIRTRRLTLKELSVGSGVPISTISKWMSGQEPKVSALLKVAKYLGVSVESLVEGKAVKPSMPKELYEALEGDFFQIFRGEFRITVERKRGEND